jgi:hypothetical protein
MPPAAERPSANARSRSRSTLKQTAQADSGTDLTHGNKCGFCDNSRVCKDAINGMMPLSIFDQSARLPCT